MDKAAFQAINKTRNRILAQRLQIARDYRSRSKGLLGRKSLEAGSGLQIIPCSSIHMFFMKFPIDAIFLDKKGEVVKTVECLGPWRLSGALFKAHSVLELPVGAIKATGTIVGDIVEINK